MSDTAISDIRPLRARRSAQLAPYQFRPGQSGNPSGRPSKITEVTHLYRDASLRGAQRLIELIEDPDGRVAALAAITGP